jgi:hypothetical protein
VALAVVARPAPGRRGGVLAGARRPADRPGHRRRRAAELVPQAAAGHRARPPAALTGAALSLLDQGDLVLGIWVALLPVWAMPAWLAAIAFAAVSAVHAVVNVVGYAIGARAAPV